MQISTKCRITSIGNNRSKAEHNSRREADVVLRGSEETRLHIVSLEPPCHGTNNPVVEASAERGGKRCVGAASLTQRNVTASEQSLCKGTNLPHGKRYARAKEKITLGNIRIERAVRPPECASSGKILRAIVGVKIGDNPNPGNDLALE
jgi:hypothetical protein